MILKELQETALTPELGGKFEDLRLRVKLVTPQVKAERAASCLDPVTARTDYAKFVAGVIPFALSLVVGWENTPTPYSDENKNKLLALLMNDETGHLKDDETPLALKDFIIKFAGDSDNFLAASAHT